MRMKQSPVVFGVDAQPAKRDMNAIEPDFGQLGRIFFRIAEGTFSPLKRDGDMRPEAPLATRPIICTRLTHFVASWMTKSRADEPSRAAADEPAGTETWQKGEHSFHG
jgi:hypothetical protein